MTFRSHLRLGLLALAFWGSLAVTSGQTPAGSAQPDEERERQIIERFVALLERNPRRGTALDRIYGYHVEQGTLDRWLETYRDRVAKEPGDGVAWLILGLFEAQRGRDAAAVTALGEAEQARPEDPLPCYYLGQALVLVGQPERAAEAFERSIARKPARTDLLEVYQALGRSYQRSRRNDQAMTVWNRLEALFPDDLRVQEQIADALVEELQWAQALPRFERLATAVKDQYRQVQFRIEAAEIKVRLGKAPEALTDFEGLLGRLNPESWLYREVRRKIEEVFLKQDDLAGMVAYYERWIKDRPDDVDALARLGQTLADQGRTAEARRWLEQGVKLAPSRRELRLALIDQLVQENEFAAAAGQYETLAQADPRNLDLVREWGRTLLKDEARPIAERRSAAAAVWHRLTMGAAPDPLVVAQVADLFRQAGMTDEAIALYEQAIALAPEAVQYREYLGEYFHTLKRPADALATWNGMAAGTRRDARNLARLGEVLAGFGYRDKAAASFAEACRLDEDELDLRLKYADLLLELERFDDGLAQLAVAETLATQEEEAEAVLDRQIKMFQGGNTLKAQADALRRGLEAGREPTARRWLRLARYLEADQRLDEAAAAVRQAFEREPKSIPARVAAARIYEMAGDLAAAAGALRELTVLDRRGRSLYLANLAMLEVRLGRNDQALEAGRELLAAAPGNIDSSQAFADLCFRLGAVDEGLDALRRSVRAHPADPKVALALAEALARQRRLDEAIELYWRVHDKTLDLEGKLNAVASLTELYLQRGQFDRLVARLERMQRDPETQREGLLGLAQAHTTSGDLGTARQVLERLLASNPRDVPLLQQLSTLSELEQDFASAVRFQKQVVDITPTEETSLRLAQLLIQTGEADEAEVILARLAAQDRDPAHALQAIDKLIATQNLKLALTLTERLTRTRPHDWDALGREGYLLAALDRPRDAARVFRAILELRADDDDPGASLKSQTRANSSQFTGAAGMGPDRGGTVPLMGRALTVPSSRILAGLEPRYLFDFSFDSAWLPVDFGQSRMLALASLLKQVELGPATAAFLAERRAARDESPRDPRPAWDWYYLQLILQDPPAVFEAAGTLASRFPSDPAAQWAYLQSLGDRLGLSAQANASSPAGTDAIPPLGSAEVDRVVAAFLTLRQLRPAWIQGEIVANTLLELKRARRSEDEARVYREAVEAASEAPALTALIPVAGERGDVKTLIGLTDKLAAAPGGQSGASGWSVSLQQAIMHLASAKRHADIPRLLDRALLHQRRAGQFAPPSQGRAALGAAGRIRNPAGTSHGTLQDLPADYPTPSRYLDQDSLSLLGSVYELYKRDDLVSDLIAAYRSRSDEADSDAERIEAHLVLAAFRWWNDDREGAIEELTSAVAISKGETDLSLELAGLYERTEARDNALAIVEGIEALDTGVLQRRETAALRLAAATGNTERARLACDRLFGLRLDTDSQTILAGQMHRLGLHEQAEAVLARTRRNAGQQSSALVGLMMEYDRQEKVDQAIQVAHQILRRGSGKPLAAIGNYNTDATAREEAIRLLARTGKLGESIERLEAQAVRSPNSMAIQETLAEYYQAANDREKLHATYQRIAALKPDDARNRFLVGFRLSQSGDAAGAVEHFRAAITKAPQLLAGNVYSHLQVAFQQAKKSDELLAILESSDPRLLVSSIAEITYSHAENPETRERVWKLVRKVWDSSPDHRLELHLNLFAADQFWERPEAYDLTLQAIVPTAARRRADPWIGIGISTASTVDEGKIVNLAGQLIKAANQVGKLAVLLKEIEDRVRDDPGWKGGQALQAILRARLGRIDEARPFLNEILDAGNTSVPLLTRWMIAQELEEVTPLTDATIALYERDLKDQQSQEMDLEFSPIHRLLGLYQRAGRIDEARELIRKRILLKDGAKLSASFAMKRIRELGAIADQLLELGSTADAILLYAEMMAIGETLPDGTNQQPNRAGVIAQAKEGLRTALERVDSNALGPLLATLLEPSPEPRQPGTPALGLVLLVDPPEIDQATVFSLVDATIAASARNPTRRAEAEKTLASQVERSPDDLSLNVAFTLAVLAGGTPESIDRATKRLGTLLDRTPLESLAPGVKANARQRGEAFGQLGLWLVARACWKIDAVRDRGDAFAARALEAAGRQPDRLWSLAMLREWGQSALERGDRVTAEMQWARMLDRIVTNTAPVESGPKPKRAKSGTAPPAPRSEKTKAPIKKVSAPVPIPAPAPVAVYLMSRTGSTSLASTVERFEQAMQLAGLAADRRMPKLSVRAARVALSSGPPMAATVGSDAANRASGFFRGRVTSQTDEVAEVVEMQFAALVAAWTSQGVAPLDCYEVLREAVLPESRPADVFLYARSLARTRTILFDAQSLTRSVGVLLVQAAVAAGRIDELRQAIEKRRSEPTAEPSASVLLAQLEMASGHETRAIKVFADLEARLRRDTLQVTSELACHAALQGLNVPALAEPAVSVLEHAVANFANYPDVDLGWSLQRIMARHWFSRNEPAKAGQVLENALATSDRSLSRLNTAPAYIMFRRRANYLQIGREYGLAGRVDDALDVLGRYRDFASGSTKVVTESGELPTSLVRHLNGLPAAERYARLKAWTLPTASRASVRLLGGFVTEDSSPPSPPFPAVRPSPSTSEGVASTIGLLIEAAGELGKLDELAGELERAVAAKAEGAKPLFLIVQIARGRADDVARSVESLSETVHASVPAPGAPIVQQDSALTADKGVDWPTYLIVRACLAVPRLRSLGERMANDLIVLSGDAPPFQPFADSLRVALAESRGSGSQGPAASAPGRPGLQFWQPSGRSLRGSGQAGPPRTSWAVQDGHIDFHGSPGESLDLVLPVTGRFEFSVDALLDEDAAASLAYGATRVTVDRNGEVRVAGLPGIEPFWTRYVLPGLFNRLTIAVEPGEVRFQVNGHLVYEQSGPVTGAPWIRLGGTKREVYRNPSITGSPRIPRSLSLVDGDALEGWSSGLYNETRSVPPGPKSSLIALPEATPRSSEFDWSVRGGVITGRRTGPALPAAIHSSRLASHCPIRDGATVSYQFYFSAGKLEVHPALGRLAFLLEPSGVRLHWLTASDSIDGTTGLRGDNGIEDPENRRGPARLPLKPDDWNSVTLTLDKGAVRISLNDRLVYERTLDPDQDRTLSFYHDKDRTEARIRAVVLEGGWPESMTVPSDLFALRPQHDANVGRAVIDEAILVANAGGVLRRARSLPPADRYEALAAWVLPGDEHSSFRLQGDFVPAGSGATIQAPALDLVDVAQQAGKLDDLAVRATAAATSSDLDRRGQHALLALIRSKQGRNAEAVAQLDMLRPLLSQVPAKAPEWQLWPELVALHGMADHPADGPVASLMDALANREVEPGAITVPRWLRHARHLRAVSRVERDASEPEGERPWKPVRRATARSRGEGDPIPVWWHRDGLWTRSPGDAEASLDFDVPLLPPFDFEAELASSPTCRTQVDYAGFRLGLEAKGATLQVSRLGRSLPDIAIAPPLEGKDPWHKVRLVVRKGMLTAFIDDRKLFEQSIDARPAPWLAIHSAPGTSAMVRKLSVTGSPEVPRTLELSGTPTLEGWSPAYFEESASGSSPAWETRGDEISGRRLKSPLQGSRSGNYRSNQDLNQNQADLYAIAGSHRESVLQYRRPLLEGGEVAYEFFYVPDQSVVHPALDRFTFLLDPDGVKEHWMTDAQYERTGLRADNATVEPANRRGPRSLPLKPHAWNRVKLALINKKVILQLNDVTVYERAMEPDNARVFGLFHYADESEARIRNVKLRGNWPETAGPAH